MTKLLSSATCRAKWTCLRPQSAYTINIHVIRRAALDLCCTAPCAVDTLSLCNPSDRYFEARQEATQRPALRRPINGTPSVEKHVHAASTASCSGSEGEQQLQSCQCCQRAGNGSRLQEASKHRQCHPEPCSSSSQGTGPRCTCLLRGWHIPASPTSQPSQPPAANRQDELRTMARRSLELPHRILLHELAR